MKMNVIQFRIAELGNLCYVLYDTSNQRQSPIQPVIV